MNFNDINFEDDEECILLEVLEELFEWPRWIDECSKIQKEEIVVAEGEHKYLEEVSKTAGPMKLNRNYLAYANKKKRERGRTFKASTECKKLPRDYASMVRNYRHFQGWNEKKKLSALKDVKLKFRAKRGKSRIGIDY